jgi:hypothetical protein
LVQGGAQGKPELHGGGAGRRRRRRNGIENSGRSRQAGRAADSLAADLVRTSLAAPRTESAPDQTEIGPNAALTASGRRAFIAGGPDIRRRTEPHQAYRNRFTATDLG